MAIKQPILEGGDKALAEDGPVGIANASPSTAAHPHCGTGGRKVSDVVRNFRRLMPSRCAVHIRGATRLPPIRMPVSEQLA
jgi:hypothetical protein